MILFIEIGEDAEEFATERISPTIFFYNVGDENTVALPIDMIRLILVSSMNIGDVDTMEFPWVQVDLSNFRKLQTHSNLFDYLWFI
jgi:hypothetical protein